MQKVVETLQQILLNSAFPQMKKHVSEARGQVSKVLDSLVKKGKHAADPLAEEKKSSRVGNKTSIMLVAD